MGESTALLMVTGLVPFDDQSARCNFECNVIGDERQPVLSVCTCDSLYHLGDDAHDEQGQR